ncbi:unnamed protein product [Callosobruchus maculatus]|uniref:Uncharacterized protein n=1 Tax=Callosobruchus maculatus TaxID=64391 RepID=A0A653CPD5_CALMS|nr:unnamed protein product [Callosobruchus maculatus]
MLYLEFRIYLAYPTLPALLTFYNLLSLSQSTKNVEHKKPTVFGA